MDPQDTPSVTAYYLAQDPSALAREHSLAAERSVPRLQVGRESEATIEVTIPTSTPPGSYFVVACGDDRGALAELSESNNCRPSTTRVQVR